MYEAFFHNVRIISTDQRKFLRKSENVRFIHKGDILMGSLNYVRSNLAWPLTSYLKTQQGSPFHQG